MKAQNLPTLIIHAPHYQVDANNRRSYEGILKSGIGTGYAINKKQYDLIRVGCKVVLLRKDKNQKRAEGKLVELSRTSKMTGNGIHRYDVVIKGLAECRVYVGEDLNRCGVNVI